MPSKRVFNVVLSGMIAIEKNLGKRGFFEIQSPRGNMLLQVVIFAGKLVTTVFVEQGWNLSLLLI